ncbi:MAG TPA: MarR family winged helix-turn-helix transcriptional regulator [Solirubrobacterales bacterium]|nr:MarR family winged helix-turn-helix transcriptional regulator [Solirubrobacterales bacterium]
MAKLGPYQAGKVLGNADSRTGFALTVLGEDFSRHIRAVLAEHDLKPRQLRILDLLDDRGPVGQRELAELMGIDHSVLVNLLNPLEDKRLVKRERDAADRRRHTISIAPAGTRRLAQADQAFRDAEDEFFAALTPKQRGQLHTLLTELRSGGEVSVGADS